MSQSAKRKMNLKTTMMEDFDLIPHYYLPTEKVAFLDATHQNPIFSRLRSFIFAQSNPVCAQKTTPLEFISWCQKSNPTGLSSQEAFATADNKRALTVLLHLYHFLQTTAMPQTARFNFQTYEPGRLTLIGEGQQNSDWRRVTVHRLAPAQDGQMDSLIPALSSLVYERAATKAKDISILPHLGLPNQVWGAYGQALEEKGHIPQERLTWK